MFWPWHNSIRPNLGTCPRWTFAFAQPGLHSQGLTLDFHQARFVHALRWSITTGNTWRPRPASWIWSWACFFSDDCLFTGRMQDQWINPEKDEPTPGSSPQLLHGRHLGGPTSLGGHVSTFGMASPAASSPVSAEVQHCALPMVAPRFGSRQQHHGSEPGLCENLIFGWGKGGNPPAVGDVWGRGVSEMILETPQNILGFLIVFSSHWSLVWLCCPHPALKMKCPRGHFFSRNAPQNLTQKQSIKERQTDFCQTYQRYCLVTFKSFSSSTDCGPNG